MKYIGNYEFADDLIKSVTSKILFPYFQTPAEVKICTHIAKTHIITSQYPNSTRNTIRLLSVNKVSAGKNIGKYTLSFIIGSELEVFANKTNEVIMEETGEVIPLSEASYVRPARVLRLTNIIGEGIYEVEITPFTTARVGFCTEYYTIKELELLRDMFDQLIETYNNPSLRLLEITNPPLIKTLKKCKSLDLHKKINAHLNAYLLFG